MTITELAAGIGGSRKAVSVIVNARRSVTAKMVMRLAKATGTSAQLWLNLQANYNLWQAAHGKKGLLDSIRPIATAI